VPESQFDKALEGDIMFDGSSIEGLSGSKNRTCAATRPGDLRVLPNGDAAGKVARVICDIYNPDGSAFAGCTRQALKRQIAKAKALGYEMMRASRPSSSSFSWMQTESRRRSRTITAAISTRHRSIAPRRFAG